jgi:hypothetical protein
MGDNQAEGTDLFSTRENKSVLFIK